MVHKHKVIQESINCDRLCNNRRCESCFTPRHWSTLIPWPSKTSLLRTILLCLVVLVACQGLITLSLVVRDNSSVWSQLNNTDTGLLLPRLLSRGALHLQQGHLNFLINSGSNPSKTKPLCPLVSPNPGGRIWITYERPTLEHLEMLHPELDPGGSWHPPNCTSRHRVALVIPYRDRQEHLRIFLSHIHPFLQKQMIDYTIYIVEQDMSSPFNRGMLLNIGFKEAESLGAQHDCYIFHDVDLLPEDERNIYSCPEMPRHMSAAVDMMGYRLPYEGLFGGIEAFSKSHFRHINGFSNKFFGWGGEDDDLYNRIKYHGLNLTRYPQHIARYRMLRHRKEQPSINRFRYLSSGKLRYEEDGLNSLIYEKAKLAKRKLYTLISVIIDEPTVILNLWNRTAAATNFTSPYAVSRRRVLDELQKSAHGASFPKQKPKDSKQ